MKNRVKRAVGFWSLMAENAGDEIAVLDRTGKGFKRDVDYIFSTLAFTSDSRVLDLCCGNGLFSFAISDRVHKVVGLDMSDSMLEMANQQVVQNVELVRGEAVSLPFRDNVFDFTYCMTSFHYFPDYSYAESAIKEIIRVTKGSGMILLTDIPARDSISYYLWNLIRSRGEGHESPLPAMRGKRGMGERIALLFRRITGRRVDSDEWLWYGKDFFEGLGRGKFKEVRVVPSQQKGKINYRFDVLISNNEATNNCSRG